MNRRTSAVLLVGVAAALVMSSIPALAGTVEGRFGWVSPAEYNKTFCVRIEVFASPDITDGQVEATFTAGGETYSAGPVSVSSGSIVSGGTKKGWRLITLIKNTKSDAVGNLVVRHVQ